MLTSQQIVTFCLFFPFYFPANRVWHLMCRHCACSCKINSCIFKRYANESAWWTRLLAWNLITSVVPCANEFTFPLCMSLFFSLFALFHFACPLQPIMRVHVMNLKSQAWQLEKGKKKSCHSKQPSHILYNKVAVVCREIRTYRDFGCLFLLILLLLLLIFPRTESGGFISRRCDSPWPREKEDGLSTASPLPPLILFHGVGLVRAPPPMWPSFSTTLILCGCLLPRSD